MKSHKKKKKKLQPHDINLVEIPTFPSFPPPSTGSKTRKPGLVDPVALAPAPLGDPLGSWGFPIGKPWENHRTAMGNPIGTWSQYPRVI